MKKILLRLWIYLLKCVHRRVNNLILLDMELYVVYQSHLVKDVYVCQNGKEAIKLVYLLNKINNKLNRNFIAVFYGRADIIFKYKIFRVLDTVFTWDASEQERRKIFEYFADVPLIKK